MFKQIKFVYGVMGGILFLLFGWDLNSYISNGIQLVPFDLILFPALIFYILGGLFLFLRASSSGQRG